MTVAYALHTLMPAEKLVYFGDTAHLPYGDKSGETIRQYSLGIADFLLEQQCKLILIACNTASANAFEEVKEHVGDRAVVMNVIDPVVAKVSAQHSAEVEDRLMEEGPSTSGLFSGKAERNSVGVIGTKATIDSGTYARKIKEQAPHLQVSSLATPLFVPMIEEGFVFDDISNAIVRSYLGRSELEGIGSLILGCTHYPIIRNQISRFFNFEVNVFDTAQIVAQAVVADLERRNLRNSASGQGNSTGDASRHKFFVSDYTPYFEVIANMFFNEKIHLEKRNIWK